jgi:hypothetical protein
MRIIQNNLATKFKAMLTKIFPNPHFFGYALPVTSTITVRAFPKLLKYQIRQERQRQVTNS